MEYKYVNEKNHLILLSLLKAYGIKRVIASPGATNITLVASMQHDPYFEMYSCVDERSAAYMACGMAEQTGEPVMLSCTGATSARDYMPGLTEAYYRKLPILTITSTQDVSKVGHLATQVTDRSVHPNDIVVESVLLQTVKDANDEWDCMIKVNRALQALTKHGGGAVHINLTTTYSRDYSIQQLPKVNKIDYYTNLDTLPEMPNGRIAVFMGAHSVLTEMDSKAIDNFCSTHDAVVFCDHTSNYRGKYRVLASLMGLQTGYHCPLLDVDLMIQIGEMSGAYDMYAVNPKQVWRVNPDGVIRDMQHRLTAVFEMQETEFFQAYSQKKGNNDDFLSEWNSAQEQLYAKIPELPFSNIWIASQLAPNLPKNSVLYLGILNSLRSWNYFETPSSVEEHSNVGGFGIDGIMSSLIGASFVDKRLHYAVVGDLSFFYDMNSLGNRQIGNNVRILIVDNGKGMEFRLINHNGAMFGDETDKYIAAGGHFGHKSPSVVRDLAKNWGYEYLTASSKEEFNKVAPRFLDPKIEDKPIVFEVFTDTESETGALKQMEEIIQDENMLMKRKIKGTVKSILGDKGTKFVKSLLRSGGGKISPSICVTVNIRSYEYKKCA